MKWLNLRAVNQILLVEGANISSGILKLWLKELVTHATSTSVVTSPPIYTRHPPSTSVTSLPKEKMLDLSKPVTFFISKLKFNPPHVIHAPSLSLMRVSRQGKTPLALGLRWPRTLCRFKRLLCVGSFPDVRYNWLLLLLLL